MDSAGLGETLFWRQRLDRLKAQIASFPVYMGNENNPTLSSYNRSAASDALDDTIRLYLTNHNAAQQGLIYLASPYRPMAVFSLVLALFLDIAAFVTGILMDGMEQYHKKKDEERTDTETSTEPWSDTDVRESKETQSSAVSPEAHLNRYIYLNGDYVRLGGKITYRAIEDGQEIEINMAEPDMKAGFYVQNEEQWALVQTPQILHLVSNPQDGIYLNRSIRYQQNALSITEASSENQYEFLANVPDNLPIYQIRNGTMTIPSLPVCLLPETHGDTLRGCIHTFEGIFRLFIREKLRFLTISQKVRNKAFSQPTRNLRFSSEIALCATFAGTNRPKWNFSVNTASYSCVKSRWNHD